MSLVSDVITGIGVVSAATLAWIKWWKPRGIEQTEIYKAFKGNHEIDIILEDVHKHIPNTVKVGLIETTNGGGIPRVGQTTYKRIIACTDSSVLRLFGEKTPNDQSYNEIIWNTLKLGEYVWKVEDIKDHAVLDLFVATQITGGSVLLIGIEKGIRLLALVIDFKDGYEPTAYDRVFMREARKQIGNIIKRENKKIELIP
jgi:hypothetical protein